ncbi:ATP12 family chaperone protein [Paracoccus rhizosphaerae]|uniref:ATP12 family chaperone protein n=1 Tax=Paracoccus rhizosphaerae TaxID=1133347 RepID=A0ABV6CI52_9RHOB|nr:ATP12 family protein [Paracoccus rhizosphaerae]
MSEWKARRFWTRVDTSATDGGYEILLDDRVLRTPGKLPLVLPTAPLAQAIAAEWDAQSQEILPHTMPLTRSANSAVEKVLPQVEGVVDMLAEYGGTDLLCYRAPEPAELVERQAAEWDPLLDWANDQMRAILRVTTGLIPVEQDPAAVARLRSEVAALDLWGLTALHDLVTIPGSLVLGLAVIRGRLTAAEAHRLSRIDEDFQIERWGADEEAAEAAEERRLSMEWAEKLWQLSRMG